MLQSFASIISQHLFYGKYFEPKLEDTGAIFVAATTSDTSENVKTF